jgi:hypothetical protein
MARARQSSSFINYFPYIMALGAVIVVVVLVIGPGGKTKEAIDKIKPRSESLTVVFEKMNGFHGDYLRWKEKAKNGESGAQSKADKYYASYKKYKARWKRVSAKKPKERKRLEEKWARNREREAYVAAQEVPSADPIERNRKLLEKKYKDLKRLDATCGSGVLNCPDIPAWSDSAKTQSAGKLSHWEWVKILNRESVGGGTMYKVQRRNDKKEAWVEGKYIKDIYDKEKLDNLKLKGSEKKDSGD